MASVSVTNTFSANTTAVANDVNTNFTDLVNYINNRNSGSATWDAVYATSSSAVPMVINNSTGSVNIANFQDNGTNVFTIADTGIFAFSNVDGSFAGTLIAGNTSKGGASDFNLINLQTNSTSRFKVTGAGAASISSISSGSGAPPLTVTNGDTNNTLSINASNASYAGTLIYGNTTKAAATDFNLVDIQTNTTSRFKIVGSGAATITTDTSSTGGPGLTITEGDTFAALTLAATNGSYNGTVLTANTTRAANSAFNLMTLTSNSVNMLLVRGDGDVVVGSAALATNATDGFLYIPSCAGTPTGTPTSFTGRFPLVIDSTNHKLYFYDGSWRDVGP